MSKATLFAVFLVFLLWTETKMQAKDSTMTINPFVPFSKVTAEDLRYIHQTYGINRFLVCGPSKSLRIVGYPEMKYYEEIAQRINEYRQALTGTPVKFSWWCMLTLKQGLHAPYQHVVGYDGKESPVGLCSLDENFTRDMAAKFAHIAKTAHPELILLEDDYSLQNYGKIKFCCFCPLHLKAFAEKTGKNYTREELVRFFKEDRNETLPLRKLWAETAGDSLVKFGEAMRAAVDQVAPETRIGWAETGGTDADGFISVRLPQALAGSKTRPLIRVRAAWYSSFDSPQRLPEFMAHAMFTTERMPKDFEAILEADTYPHTTYFGSAGLLQAQIDNALAMGMDNILLYAIQYGDYPTEDPSYLEMYRKNVHRFEELSRICDSGHLTGAKIVYDPMSHSAKMLSKEGRTCMGHLFNMLARMGIPFSTRYGSPAILAGPTADVLPDDEIRKLLGNAVLLDSEAAAILEKRGYGELIGVQVKPVDQAFFREEMSDIPLFDGIRGRRIPIRIINPAGNEAGVVYNRLVPLKGAESLSHYLDGNGQPVQPGMTRFTNSLGGRVCVLASGIAGNFASNLFSLRKQEMLRRVFEWLRGESLPAVVSGTPNVWLLVRECPGHTLIFITNLSTADRTGLPVYLSPGLMNRKIEELQLDGSWRQINVRQDVSARTAWLPGDFRPVQMRVFRIETQPSAAGNTLGKEK